MVTRPKAPLCLNWEAPVVTGKLDATLVPEASGLAVSRKYSRLYHVNDSGDDGVFYVSKKDGTGTRKVRVEGFNPRDAEDLSLGPCGNSTCLYLADIGDNREARKSIEVVLVEETENFGEKVKPRQRVKLIYPDRAHNAEALAVHPNGDLFVVTKEMTKEKVAQTALVFRLPKKSLERPGAEARTLEPWGQLDVPTIVAGSGYEGLVTGMSLSPDGKRVLLLTYDKALEIAWDLSAGPWPGANILATNGQLSVIPIRRLKQQEAISYDESGIDFIYNTEHFRLLGIVTGDAEIITMRCR